MSTKKSQLVEVWWSARAKNHRSKLLFLHARKASFYDCSKIRFSQGPLALGYSFLTKKGSLPDARKFIKQIISTTLKLFLWKLLDWFSQDAMQTILSSVRLSSLDVRKSGYDVNPSAMWYMFLCMSYTNLREFVSVLLVYSIYGTLIKWTSWVVKIVTWIQK